MPQLNKSEAVRVRTRYLLQRLTGFANYEVADCEHLENKISVRWLDLDTVRPKLIVKTEIRFLAALVSPAVDRKTKDHLKQDLRSLKDFLGILEDNRDRTQGTGLWHFTLKLWHRSVERNLTAFDELWQQRKAAFKEASANRIAERQTESPRESRQTAGSSESSSVNPDAHAVADGLPPEKAQATTGPALATYHNLPARDYGTFVGREQTLQQIDDFLKPNHPVSRVSLTGIGGVGKTALALEVAHRRLIQYSDMSMSVPASASRLSADAFSALIFISAKAQRLTPQGILPSYRYSRTLQDIFRAIAQTLKRPDLLAGDFERQLENTYELLSWQRTLLILDNLESVSSADQAAILAFLYELPTTVKAIVTSRIQLTLDAVIPLEPLVESEALQLIRHQASLKALALSNADSQSLYTQTGGMPAAITYAIGQAATGYPIPRVLPQLTRQTSDYCRYYLENSVQALQGQPAYDVLLALATFSISASLEALASVAQLSAAETIETLALLQRIGLVTRQSVEVTDRFSMLSLTRDYLLSQLEEIAEETIKVRSLLWYQTWLVPYQALNWREWQDYTPLDSEWENLQALVEWCIATERYDDFVQLWNGLRGYTHLRGYWNERLGWLTWWLEAAEQKEDMPAVINALRDLGWSLTLMGQPQQLETANGYFARAWRYRQAAEVGMQIDLATESAVLHLFQARLAKVQPWLETAAALLAAAEQAEPALSASVLLKKKTRIAYYTAQLYYRQEKYVQAKSLYQELLSWVQADADEDSQRTVVYILNWLVDIALQQAELDEAERLLARSWPMIQDRQDVRSQAFHQRSRAKLEKMRGNLAECRRWSERAKACFGTLGMQSYVEEMQAWLAESAR
ncbi:MAG: AAA family ATPase [Phormidesmis sp.]